MLQKFEGGVLNKILLIFLPCTLLGGVFAISDSQINSRSSGMRNSDIAIVRQNGNFFSNPAIMSMQKEIQFSSVFHNYFSDVFLTGIIYSHPDLLLQGVSTGFSIASINYGSFTDIESGYQYRPYELMLTVSQGYLFSKILSGINVKYAYSSITSEYTSSAIILDVGLLYATDDQSFSFALGFFNAGFQLDRYYETTEDIPSYLKSGAGYKLKKVPLKITFQHEYYHRFTSRYAAGLELDAKDNLVVRCGYDFNGAEKHIGTNSNKEKFGGLSFGATVFLNEFEFDLAYLINGELEDEFGLSINIKLTELLNKL